MIPVTVATYKTKKGAYDFIQRTQELKESDSVTIVERYENRFDVVAYFRP